MPSDQPVDFWVLHLHIPTSLQPMCLFSYSKESHQRKQVQPCFQSNTWCKARSICKAIPELHGNPIWPASDDLTLLSATLSNLGRETSLNSSNTSSGTARVASNEIQSVLSLVEFSIWRSAGFAGDIFH
jgi:hypothetical protein